MDRHRKLCDLLPSAHSRVGYELESEGHSGFWHVAGTGALGWSFFIRHPCLARAGVCAASVAVCPFRRHQLALHRLHALIADFGIAFIEYAVGLGMAGDYLNTKLFPIFGP